MIFFVTFFFLFNPYDEFDGVGGKYWGFFVQLLYFVCFFPVKKFLAREKVGCFLSKIFV